MKNVRTKLSIIDHRCFCGEIKRLSTYSNLTSWRRSWRWRSPPPSSSRSWRRPRQCFRFRSRSRCSGSGGTGGRGEETSRLWQLGTQMEVYYNALIVMVQWMSKYSIHRLLSGFNEIWNNNNNTFGFVCWSGSGQELSWEYFVGSCRYFCPDGSNIFDWKQVYSGHGAVGCECWWVMRRTVAH